MQGGAASTLLNGLVAAWKMDDLAGNMIDSKGSNDGALSGDITQGVAGKIGTAYNFTGTNGQVNVPGGVVVGTPMSASVWIKFLPPPATNGRIFTVLVNGASNDILSLFVNTTGQVIVQHFDGSNANTVSGVGYDDGAWHHVVAIWNSDSLRSLYIDNGFISSNNVVQNAVAGSDTQIGYADFSGVDTQYYKGDLDDLNVWNRVLTVPEIAELWNSGTGKSYPF